MIYAVVILSIALVVMCFFCVLLVYANTRMSGMIDVYQGENNDYKQMVCDYRHLAFLKFKYWIPSDPKELQKELNEAVKHE